MTPIHGRCGAPIRSSATTSFHPASSEAMVKVDPSLVLKAIARNQFDQVIKTPNLFKSLFFDIRFRKVEAKSCIVWKLDGTHIVATGSHANLEAIIEAVEKIRRILEKNWSCKKFEIILLQQLDDYVLDDLLKSSCVRLRLKSLEINHLILPCLEEFIQSLGADCSSSNREFKCPPDGKVLRLPVFKIEKREDFLTYPIDPVVNPKPYEKHLELYSMYQSGILCDLSLKASDGELKVHSSQTYINGGDAIKSMLVSGMKESNEKIISFPEFKLATLRHFVDYLYLGETSLTLKIRSSEEIDLVELFEFAHTYQVIPLINFCTNALSSVCTISNIDTIKNLDEKYGNAHLKKLFEYLAERALPKK